MPLLSAIFGPSKADKEAMLSQYPAMRRAIAALQTSIVTVQAKVDDARLKGIVINDLDSRLLRLRTAVGELVTARNTMDGHVRQAAAITGHSTDQLREAGLAAIPLIIVAIAAAVPVVMFAVWQAARPKIILAQAEAAAIEREAVARAAAWDAQARRTPPGSPLPPYPGNPNPSPNAGTGDDLLKSAGQFAGGLGFLIAAAAGAWLVFKLAPNRRRR